MGDNMDNQDYKLSDADEVVVRSTIEMFHAVKNAKMYSRRRYTQAYIRWPYLGIRDDSRPASGRNLLPGPATAAGGAAESNGATTAGAKSEAT
jgi:hypothetical protein